MTKDTIKRTFGTIISSMKPYHCKAIAAVGDTMELFQSRHCRYRKFLVYDRKYNILKNMRKSAPELKQFVAL